MNTENTIATQDVERVGKLELLRVVDFEKIAANAEDGKISVEDLQNGGDFIVQVRPSKRGADPVRTPVADEASGRAFMAGFAAAVEMKKKGPRKPKGEGDSKPKRASKSKTSKAK